MAMKKLSVHGFQHGSKPYWNTITGRCSDLQYSKSFRNKLYFSLTEWAIIRWVLYKIISAVLSISLRILLTKPCWWLFVLHLAADIPNNWRTKNILFAWASQPRVQLFTHISRSYIYLFSLWLQIIAKFYSGICLCSLSMAFMKRGPLSWDWIFEKQKIIYQQLSKFIYFSPPVFPQARLPLTNNTYFPFMGFP